MMSSFLVLVRQYKIHLHRLQVYNSLVTTIQVCNSFTTAILFQSPRMCSTVTCDCTHVRLQKYSFLFQMMLIVNIVQDVANEVHPLSVSHQRLSHCNAFPHCMVASRITLFLRSTLSVSSSGDASSIGLYPHKKGYTAIFEIFHQSQRFSLTFRSVVFTASPLHQDRCSGLPGIPALGRNTCLSSARLQLVHLITSIHSCLAL